MCSDSNCKVCQFIQTSSSDKCTECKTGYEIRENICQIPLTIGKVCLEGYYKIPN